MAFRQSLHRWLVLALLLSLLFPGALPASAQSHAAADAPGCHSITTRPLAATTETDVYSITASANDASRYIIGMTASTQVANTVMKLGYSPSDDDSGSYRFISVTWPSGAQLLAAHFSLTAQSAADKDLSQLHVYGEAADSAAAYSSSEDFTQRSLTSASVIWSPGAWSANQTKSITVTEVISEVLSRPGWSSGNPIALQVRSQSGGFGYVWAWDGSITDTAQLELIYSVSAIQPGAGCTGK